jgi:hypothetical protein
MAEWSIAAVLKTVEGQTSGGSNPSLSAKRNFSLLEFLSNPLKHMISRDFLFEQNLKLTQIKLKTITLLVTQKLSQKTG